MFTAESLTQYAIEQEAIAEKFVAEGFGPGTIHNGRNAASHNARIAMNAAWYMEHFKISKLAHIGTFRSFEVKKGDKVRVKKGALIRTTHPKGNRVAKRDNVVTVHSVDNGYINDYPIEKIFEKNIGDALRNPSITWPGTGGYWCTVSFNDIELVKE